MSIHPANQEELDMLRERFPGKTELTLDEYAEYFSVSRGYASQHFSRANRGPFKIGHKRLGRNIIIPLVDFACWLTQHKILDGKKLVLPSEKDVAESMKRRRGFAPMKQDTYRSLG